MRTRCLSVSIASFALIVPCCAQSLRQEAEKAGLRMGAAVRPAQFSEPVYVSTLSREFNLLEPEDAMKWWVLRPDAATFDFRQGDEIVRYAHAHDMSVRGHCLVWGRDNPEWLEKGRFMPAQLSRLLHQHINRVMKHYAGHVSAWDVVNEALDENGNVRSSIWYNQPGIGLAGKDTAYIKQVFRWAHNADPKALLFYNEAEGEGLGPKSDAIYAMVKDFKHRGVPIDGVGLQMHVPNLNIDLSAVAENISRLVALGVQVHITELDVALPVNSNGELVDPSDLMRQADVYSGIVRTCLKNAGCTAIQTWGFTDKYSWIGSHSHGTRGQALLFDRNYQPKPSYRAVLDALISSRRTAH
jgi:endo-1,4-beta-xylanase